MIAGLMPIRERVLGYSLIWMCRITDLTDFTRITRIFIVEDNTDDCGLNAGW